MNACSETLAPGIGAYSEIANAGRLCDLAELSDLAVETCRLDTDELGADALRDTDIKVLCAVFCCCKSHPNLGSDRNLYDSCASETLGLADELSGNQSRYKSQVSYNMRADPPVPLMKKDLFGNLSTTPLTVPDEIAHMIHRIEKECPGVAPFGGSNMRRPDAVVVRDPRRPPTAENISNVVDFKFLGDGWADGQRESYERINNGRQVIEINDEECDCDDSREQEQAVTLLAASQAYRQEQRSALERVGWGALSAVGAVAAVVAAVCPADGPFGEAATGLGTAAAWARAVGSVAVGTLRSAVTARAAETMQTLFSGATLAPP